MLREILGRAEPFFRKDKIERQKMEHSKRMRPLEQQVKELEARMEAGDESDELMAIYDQVWGQLNDLRMEHASEKDVVSPEWTTLMQAIGTLPSNAKSEGVKPANLRLIIDAIDRIKEEGEGGGEFLRDVDTSQAAK